MIPVDTPTAAVDEPKLLHQYEPRGTARQVLERRDRELVSGGPAGTGKSHAHLMKVLLCALKYPGMRALFTRQTADSLRDSTLVEWRESVATELIENGTITYYSGSRSTPPGYQFSNGSRISLGGMDKPSKIMSRQYDMIFVDEVTELSLAAWEALKTRLRSPRMPYRQILGACNPDAPTHWVKKRSENGVLTLLTSRHWENPRWFEDIGPDLGEDIPDDGSIEVHDGRVYRITPSGVEYLRETLGDLTGITRLRMLDGLWCAADGVIYTDWNPAIHVVDPYPIPDDWPRFWSIDFGMRNPFVCQWWAITPDDQFVLYREIYHTGRIVEDHCRQILRIVTAPTPGLEISPDQLAADELEPLKALEEGRRVWIEPKPQRVITDHDSEDRATFRRHIGLVTKPAKKQVKRGIEVTEKRMRPGRHGKPGLVIMRNCRVEKDKTLEQAGKPTCTEEEVPQYSWAPPVNGRSPKEEPLKENDHGCDAKRYFIADRDLRVSMARDRSPYA